MYFANPVVIFGAVMLLLMLVTLVWQKRTKSEGMRNAARALMRVSLVWSVVMLLLGGIMGLNHASAHPKCLQMKAAGDDLKGKGCDYFFEHYGN